MHVEVRPVPDSGTLPLIALSVLSVSIGDIRVQQVCPMKGGESRRVRNEKKSSNKMSHTGNVFISITSLFFFWCPRVVRRKWTATRWDYILMQYHMLVTWWRIFFFIRTKYWKYCVHLCSVWVYYNDMKRVTCVLWSVMGSTVAPISVCFSSTFLHTQDFSILLVLGLFLFSNKNAFIY